MSASYFADIEPIKFEGLESTNPFAYRYYDEDRVVMGKTMAEHLRMAVCYWHTFCWDGFDVFGAGTFNRPWHGGPIDQARADRMAQPARPDVVSGLDGVEMCRPRPHGRIAVERIGQVLVEHQVVDGGIEVEHGFGSFLTR